MTNSKVLEEVDQIHQTYQGKQKELEETHKSELDKLKDEILNALNG